MLDIYLTSLQTCSNMTIDDSKIFLSWAGLRLASTAIQSIIHNWMLLSWQHSQYKDALQTHCPPERCGSNFTSVFFTLIYEPISCALPVKLVSGECHKTSMITILHWYRKLLGDVRQQGITWANVDQDLCHHRAPQGHNGLTHWGRDKMAAVSQTTLSNPFSQMKMLEFQLRFHWSFFLRVQLIIFQHWFK